MNARARGGEAVVERGDDLSLGTEEYYGEYLGVGITIKRLGSTETLDDFAIYSDGTDETLPEDAYYLGSFTVRPVSPTPSPSGWPPATGWRDTSWRPCAA
jgi:hypothetical protein